MKILSFGEIIWDIFGEGKHLGGAPLNFAAHCSNMGLQTWLVSAVGDDELGKIALTEIKKFGINEEYISKVSGKSTGICTVSLDKRGVPAYEIADDVSYDYIEAPIFAEKTDVIAFGTLALRREHNRAVLNEILMRNNFSEIFSDINIREPFCSKESIEFCLKNATLLKISDEELPRVNNIVFGGNLSLTQSVKSLSRSYEQIKVIIITKGSKGSCCYDCKSGQFYKTGAKSIDVVSTVGAGDSFSAAFIAKYLMQDPYKKCLDFASKVSAAVCSRKESVPKDMSLLIKNL